MAVVVDLVPDFGTVSCPPGGEASKACPRGTITFTCTTTTTGALVWLTSLTDADTATYLSSAMPPSPQTLSAPNATLFQTVLSQNGATLISNLTVTEEFRAQAAMGAVTAVDIICQDNLVGEANMRRTLEISQDRPSPPMNVRRSPLDLCSAPLDTIAVEWNCPISTGGTNITRYTVIVDGLCNYTVEDGRSVTITGLPPNTNYRVFVTAENCAGESAFSNAVDIFNSTVPSAPTGLTFQLDCSTLMSSTTPTDVSWQSPTGNQALPCPVMQVCVDCIDDNCLPQCRPASSNPYRIDNTVSGENYTVRLSLVNGIGRSELSDPLQFDITNFFQTEVNINSQSVECQLPLSFTGITQCSIRYGVDSTYEDLPYVDESSGGTGDGSNVTVQLTHQLQPLTTYYYVAFANSSSMCAEVSGSFSTGCPHVNLGFMETIQDERCSGLQGSALITGGIVCYNGVIPGSIALYICNSTHHLEGSNIRVCQSNGNWSGTIPQCVAIPPEVVCTTVGLGAGAVVGVSITIFLLSFTFGALLAAFICALRWRGKSSGQPHTSPSEGPQPGPVYEVVEEQLVDVLEMKDNIAYGPVSH